MQCRPGFHPLDPHVRNTKDGRLGIITQIQSSKRIFVMWFGGFGGNNEVAEYDMKEDNPNLEAYPVRPKFRVKTVVHDKNPQWITCVPQNEQAKAVINGKLAAIRPITDRFSENVMKRASFMQFKKDDFFNEPQGGNSILL